MSLNIARRTRFAPVAAAGLIVLAGLAIAGPLNPPAGPVGSTMKTLTEVEPRIALNSTNTPGDVVNQFKITQPGSYYLTADMASTPGLNPCIVIAANDVTLDLSGYSIRTTATHGVTIAGDRVTVRNGRITLSGGNIDAGVLMQSGADDARMEGLTVSVMGSGSACVRTQVNVTSASIRDSILIGGVEGVDVSEEATAWTVTDVQCRGQSSSGIIVGRRSVVERCVVRDVSNGGGNFGNGIFAAEDSVVRECEVTDSRSTGSVGPQTAISAGSDSIVENCKVSSRGTVGIAINGARVTVRNSRVYMLTSGSTGIKSLLGGDYIADNQISAVGGTGIRLDTSGSVVIRNYIKNATTPIGGPSLANCIIGPTASNGNPTASTSPHANFVN